jgi:anaphase-promoting complex subunit 8
MIHYSPSFLPKGLNNNPLRFQKKHTLFKRKSPIKTSPHIATMASSNHDHSSPEDQSFSTAMSLDESSIHLTSATPSFAGNGRAASANTMDANHSLFSPNESTMSISQLDTPYNTSPKGKFGSFKNGGPTLQSRLMAKKLSVDTNNNNNNNDGRLMKPHPNGEIDMEDSLSIHPWNVDEARLQLRKASLECHRRGLKIASLWAAEQLCGLPAESSTAATASELDSLDNNTTNIEIYASSLFQMGEYSRCIHTLSAIASSSTMTDFGTVHPPRTDLTSMGIYLRSFAMYLQGERRKDEEISELREALERTCVQNTYLNRLEVELRRYYSRGELDSFGLYVYGVVLKDLSGVKKKKSSVEQQQCHVAHEIFIQSILKYPYNWSAWLDLAEICVRDPSIDREVERLLLPLSNHWMYHFFCVHVFIENKANENAIAVIDKLVHGEEEGDDTNNAEGFFVQSPYLQTQLAMAYYDVRDYDSAHEHFLALSEREPYRLDHMDAFSNVLYVKDQKVALSHLAHRSISIDKYRPETCIIVGNYYSSKGRHEKAVQYFQRALKLNRNYLGAWTLLGHEYIEMKNTAAAIEAYRRAVDISDREYRAWYGLGQTYEIMNMLLHALFYFRKAAALHPHDARMWCAIGGCLLGLDRRNDAEKSYERAVSLGDGEGIATRKLAELYREDGDEEKAAKCYLRHLELRYHSQLSGPFTGASADSSPEALENVVRHVRVDEPEAEALLYLAYYYRDNLEYDVAILCATRLEDYPGPEKEQGKSLLRDIRSRMDQKAGGRRPGHPPRSPTTPPMNTMRGARTDLSMDTSSVANAESSFEFSP